MNKKISLLLVLVLLGTFTACGSNQAPSQESTAVSSAISSSEAASTEPASTDNTSTGATPSVETAAAGTAGEEAVLPSPEGQAPPGISPEPSMRAGHTPCPWSFPQ